MFTTSHFRLAEHVPNIAIRNTQWMHENACEGVWMHEECLLPGRSYLIKAGSATAPAQISALKHKINVNTLQREPGKTLELNEVGICNISLTKPISFDPYQENRSTGNFILIDRFTNATVGAGMIDFPLRRATNIHWQSIDINKQSRAEMNRKLTPGWQF